MNFNEDHMAVVEAIEALHNANCDLESESRVFMTRIKIVTKFFENK